MKIRLVTEDGNHVVDHDLPPFQSYPEVVVWGIRTFRLDTYPHNNPITYRECFAYTVAEATGESSGTCNRSQRDVDADVDLKDVQANGFDLSSRHPGGHIVVRCSQCHFTKIGRAYWHRDDCPNRVAAASPLKEN